MAADEEQTPRVTIYDVAEVAGVSASTVSRAFSRPGRVSYETAERIRRIAEELGYRQRELRVDVDRLGNTSRMLAFMLADISNPVFFEIIRGAEEEASRRGYTLLLLHTKESSETERRMIADVMDSVDGVILASSRLSDSGIRTIAKQRAAITLNRGVSGVPCVVADNARGMRRALEHLAGLDHRSFVYLAGPEASWANGVRWRSLREGAMELGLGASQLQSSEPTMAGGAILAEAVLASEATAVIAYNDLLAAGLLRRLQELGHSIPDDVSIVGFDNTTIAQLTLPGLTTVASPLNALGATAVRNLLEPQRDPGHDRLRPVVLPTRLAVRGSTGPAPSRARPTGN